MYAFIINFVSLFTLFVVGVMFKNETISTAYFLLISLICVQTIIITSQTRIIIGLNSYIKNDLDVKVINYANLSERPRLRKHRSSSQHNNLQTDNSRHPGNSRQKMLKILYDRD